VFGGQGNDLIFGGEGADVIFGDRGADTMRGQSGFDDFVFNDDSGIDLLLDYNPNEDDRIGIAFDVNGSGITDVDDIFDRMFFDGEVTEIDLGFGNVIEIFDIRPSQLLPSDFFIF
jgi:Ca2+-binding RTX toxin-like protein